MPISFTQCEFPFALAISRQRFRAARATRAGSCPGMSVTFLDALAWACAERIVSGSLRLDAQAATSAIGATEDRPKAQRLLSVVEMKTWGATVMTCIISSTSLTRVISTTSRTVPLGVL